MTVPRLLPRWDYLAGGLRVGLPQGVPLRRRGNVGVVLVSSRWTRARCVPNAGVTGTYWCNLYSRVCAHQVSWTLSNNNLRDACSCRRLSKYLPMFAWNDFAFPSNGSYCCVCPLKDKKIRAVILFLCFIQYKKKYYLQSFIFNCFKRNFFSIDIDYFS